MSLESNKKKIRAVYFVFLFKNEITTNLYCILQNDQSLVDKNLKKKRQKMDSSPQTVLEAQLLTTACQGHKAILSLDRFHHLLSLLP